MEKESKRLHYEPTFLPHVLWLYTLAALTLTTVALWCYVGTAVLLYFYERKVVQPIANSPYFFKTLSRSFVFFLLLFVLVYGLFLRIGQHAWLTLEWGQEQWVWTYEALVFGLHYGWVLVVLLWIAYLIHQQKRILTLQYYFGGSLYPLTIIWNHSIRSFGQMMEWKTQYQQALAYRQRQMSSVAYVKHLVLFLFDRAFWEVRHKLPVMLQRWRQTRRIQARWIEKGLFLLPCLFFLLAYGQPNLSSSTHGWLTILLWVIGFAMVFEVYTKQRIMLQQPPIWRWQDIMVLLLLACAWIFYGFGPSAFWQTSILEDGSAYISGGLSDMSLMTCLVLALFLIIQAGSDRHVD